MSGWMKYPYIECLDCEKYDPDDEDNWTIVNTPLEACSHNNDCPVEKVGNSNV